MKSPQQKLFARATQAHATPIMGIACVVLALSLCSCGFIPSAQRATPLNDEGGPPLRYSIVCIIHGDGSYVYHDTRGDAQKADEVTLDKARMVAERNAQAEVFIFHERRRGRRLLFFPRRDGAFYYYRRGRLLAEESYWRDKGQSRFDPEMELYSRFRAPASPELVQLFLYFGHEIPEFGGEGYDASYKNRTFTVDDLADGLKRITRDSKKVDLVVLSTCFNGTPRTIAALAPYARYVIASPGNLHLSYFDLGPLEQLDAGLREGNVSAFASTFAHHAFDKLTEDMQTSVTVAVYDVDRAQDFLRSAGDVYEQNATKLKGTASGSIEHCDCAEDPRYALPGMEDGVVVLYRPSRFGRLAHKESHSGWGCWKLLN